MKTRIEGLHRLGSSQIEIMRFAEDTVLSDNSTEEKERLLRKLDGLLMDTVLRFRLENHTKLKGETSES